MVRAEYNILSSNNKCGHTWNNNWLTLRWQAMILLFVLRLSDAIHHAHVALSLCAQPIFYGNILQATTFLGRG